MAGRPTPIRSRRPDGSSPRSGRLPRPHLNTNPDRRKVQRPFPRSSGGRRDRMQRTRPTAAGRLPVRKDGMFARLSRPARALIWVRIFNQLGAYALGFLAVLAGPDLAPPALAVFGVAALLSRWAGGLLLDRLAPRTVVAAGLAATGGA